MKYVLEDFFRMVTPRIADAGRFKIYILFVRASYMIIYEFSPRDLHDDRLQKVCSKIYLDISAQYPG